MIPLTQDEILYKYTTTTLPFVYNHTPTTKDKEKMTQEDAIRQREAGDSLIDSGAERYLQFPLP